ncbi:MAG: biosynthetic peptidoglycan transglycosylase [Tannerellaceae bacterium]
MTKNLKQGLIIGLLVPVALIALLLAGRNQIIRPLASHKLEAIGRQNHLRIHYAGIRMEGISGIRIEGLSVIPEGADTFLTAAAFEIKLNLLPLLLLRADVQYLTADDLSIRFIKDGNTSNFDFLYRTHKAAPVNPKDEQQNYATKAGQTFGLLFKLLPDNATMHNLSLSYENRDNDLCIEIPDFRIIDSRFRTEISSTENGQQSKWICEGALQDNKQQMEVSLFARENTRITLPFLAYRWGATIQFDTLAFQLSVPKGTAQLQQVEGKALVSGLTLHHQRISPDTVLLDSGTFNYKLNIGTNYLEMDSATEVRFNKLSFHPYAKAEKTDEWHLTAAMDKRDFPANDLFASLPSGLFSNLEGLQAAGTLTYHFLLDIDFKQLDSLTFESTIQSKGFHILKYGNTDLRRMNEPFIYTAYEQGEPVRTFEVGEANPSYRNFAAVSPYLPLAIMQSEDAGFFNHAGFIPSAIRESLIQNLKEHRFARGGSTLSMQLVKNIFLSRNKTIARKVEEILIVWLIESNRLTSKERMFEVYLNIVEWGPLIYGAAEASRFYFAKEPSALTLGECIFLASIIPKPKHVRSCFDGTQLKSYYNNFYHVILTRLIDRGLITSEEAVGVTPALQFSATAQSFLFKEAAPEDKPVDEAEQSVESLMPIE